MNGHVEPYFKVIIIGAGVGGLTLAHSLHKADIDYVILDKHPVAPEWGASITIHTQSARILDQLGLLPAVEAQCTEMRKFWHRDQDGKCYLAQDFIHFVNRRTGYIALTMERRAYLKTLYEQLPDKSKVIEHARVVNIIEENNKVRAVLSDGTEHVGDIIAGCDGVHSGVRDIMWQKADNLSPGLISVAEKHAIKTEYSCLIGITPYIPGLGTQDMTTVANDKFSFLFLTQPDAIYFIVVSKLPKIVRYPNRLRFSQADADARAAELADCPISDNLVFGDIWKARSRGQMVSLEEGILSHWSFGRTVLVGDAAHKVTPNAALGGNLAIEGAVRLANELHTLVNRHPNKKPTDTEVRNAFQAYQELHKPRVKELFDISWMMTRMQAYDGWLMYFIQRWVLPTTGLEIVALQVAKACLRAPKLSYIPFKERVGSLPWEKHHWEKDDVFTQEEPLSKDPGSNNKLVIPIVLISLAVYVVSLLVFGIWRQGAPAVA
ncbi:fad binding domain-containing protein [Alternaria burnsii]|uniref:Fad binding domain-containing protein n=1 Tax=Alternaria burnsii TaxID=1187904 RepID=A0A8H7EMB0_9PLEO|nr:fad binding domain-containing protein [Alternaria burnsii]KAF7681038.1 fad binding domain-containing protein [Alternaria burnsii]